MGSTPRRDRDGRDRPPNFKPTGDCRTSRHTNAGDGALRRPRRRSGAILMAGRADAVAFADGQPVVVFDWKSDVAPSAADRRTYAGQLLEYMEAVGAPPRGSVFYLPLRELD